MSSPPLLPSLLNISPAPVPSNAPPTMLAKKISSTIGCKALQSLKKEKAIGNTMEETRVLNAKFFPKHT